MKIMNIANVGRITKREIRQRKLSEREKERERQREKDRQRERERERELSLQISFFLLLFLSKRYKSYNRCYHKF